MKIYDFRIETEDQLTKAVATVTWEDCDRPTTDIYFATTSEFSQHLDCNPHAFLVSCIMPAMRFGEKRIAIEGEICPELVEGLETAVSWMRHWYGGNRNPVAIEAKVMTHLPEPIPERAGFFFSGGVDSLAALKNNRIRFPKEHPGYFQDGFIIYGIENYNSQDSTNKLDAFNLHLQAIDRVSKEAGITLIPIYTNVKSLEEDWEFWRNEFQGAVLAAAAHAFANRITQISIGGTFDIKTLEPWGSHPVIDANFSTSYLKVHHSNIALSRLDKVKLIADWPVALDNVKVCFRNSVKQLNCGNCEKCVRTMSALLAIDKLADASAFHQSNVTEELIMSKAYVDDAYVESCYLELVEPLQAKGREDLVNGIRRTIDRYHERDFQGIVKRFDRKILGGSLYAWTQKRKTE